MKKLLFALALLCVAAGTIQAQNVYQWFGTDGPRTVPPNTNWDEGYSWLCEVGPTAGTHGVAPGAYDKVKIFNVAWGDNWEQYSPVITRAGTEIGDIFMGDGGTIVENLTVAAGASLTVNGASSTTIGDGQINLAYASKDLNTFTVAGTVTVDGPIHVGWGGTGALILNGGTVSTLGLDVAGFGGHGSVQVNNGGTLSVEGYLVDIFQGWVDDGILTADGSGDNVVITFDDVAGRTIVTPEPISIALMGLGGLLLRKRS